MQVVVIQLCADFFQKPEDPFQSNFLVRHDTFELLLDSGFSNRVNSTCRPKVHCSPDRAVFLTEILSIRATAEAAALMKAVIVTGSMLPAICGACLPAAASAQTAIPNCKKPDNRG
ncbi:MAG: hypothetical protein ABI563_04620 [Specibacter sp.]